MPTHQLLLPQAPAAYYSLRLSMSRARHWTWTVGATKYYLIAGRNALLIYQMRVVDPETETKYQDPRPNTKTQCKCSYVSVSQA